MRHAKLGFLIVLVTLILGSTIFTNIVSCNESQFQSSIIPKGTKTVAHSNLFLLTYTSNWNSTPTVVNTGDSVIGDGIVLNATWIGQEEVNYTRIIVNATAVPLWISAESNRSTVDIYVRGIGYNHTCTITMTAWIVNGSTLSRTRQDVFFGMFFAPRIEVLAPNGGEIWVGVNNITWIAWDNNSVETLSFEVLVSYDSGKSFMLLASNVEENWYPWNCSTFLISDTYLIEVRVTDGIYTSFDRSDSTFTAGGVVLIPTTTPPITTTPTPTPTPTPSTPILTTTSTTESTSSVATSSVTTVTSTTTPVPLPQTNYILAIILSSTIIASAFLAVFVYYLASRKL